MQLSQHKGVVRLLTVLAFLWLPRELYASPIEFKPYLSEFSLRNFQALQRQIDLRTGLGYQSLQTQLKSQGCQPNTLAQINQSSRSAANFAKQLSACVSRAAETRSLVALLQNKQAYLITAGASLNAPMSYLGHTLLLFLDPDNFYFSPVISVLAPFEGENKFAQTLSGGFATITAEVNVIPLHQVISSYANQDARELNFLQLPEALFNPALLTEYFSTLSAKKLSYNFFKQNCSTYTYEALGYACDCLPARTLVSPKTIQKKVYQALQRAGLPAQSFTVHSLLTRYQNAYAALSKDQQKQLRKRIQNKDTSAAADQDAANAAALGSRVLFETYNDARDSYDRIVNANHYRSFLKTDRPAREQVPASDKYGIYESSLRASARSAAVLAQYSLVDKDTFKYENAHNNLSKVAIGQLALAYQDQNLKLDSLGLFDISTIKPMTFIAKQPSWRFKLGASRRHDGKLRPQLHYGLGAAVSLAGLYFYSIPSIELNSTVDSNIYSGIKFRLSGMTVEYEIRNHSFHQANIAWRRSPQWGLELETKTNHQGRQHWLSIVYSF